MHLGEDRISSKKKSGKKSQETASLLSYRIDFVGGLTPMLYQEGIVSMGTRPRA